MTTTRPINRITSWEVTRWLFWRYGKDFRVEPIKHGYMARNLDDFIYIYPSHDSVMIDGLWATTRDLDFLKHQFNLGGAE